MFSKNMSVNSLYIIVLFVLLGTDLCKGNPIDESNQDTTKKIAINEKKPKPEIQKIISSRHGIALFRVNNMDFDNIPEIFPSAEDDFVEMKQLKDEVEDFQEDDLVKETGLEENFGHRRTGVEEIFNEEIEVNNINFNNHHLTIVLATLLSLICLAMYIGLIYYRQSLKRRYGMRQLLVTNDDDTHSNDSSSLNDVSDITKLKSVP